MAQSQEMLQTGLVELSLLITTTGSTAASPIAKIVCMESTGDTCTAAETSTFASPVDSHSTTGYGLSIATCTINTTDTTGGDAVVEYDKVFTCSSTAAKTVSGIHLCNNDGTVSFIECCFASVISMENTDTLTIDGSLTLSGSTT